MKYAHIDENNKLLGWYDDKIHKVIPKPNIEVTEEQWQNALDNNHNKINNDGSTEQADFRTEDEKREEFEINFRAERNLKLKEVDIKINIAEDNGEDTSTLRAYRQALRDATKTWRMPKEENE